MRDTLNTFKKGSLDKRDGGWPCGRIGTKKSHIIVRENGQTRGAGLKGHRIHV